MEGLCSVSDNTDKCYPSLSLSGFLIGVLFFQPFSQNKHMKTIKLVHSFGTTALQPSTDPVPQRTE